MKILLSVFLFFLATISYSQTDHNGNPVFNSVSKSEETIDDFKIISSYYTLKSNIENKSSSVYISDNPTLNEISNAATNLPSDFFLIMKGQNLVNLVIIINEPSRK